MIRVFLKSTKGDYDATALFNISSKEITILKDSLVSPIIAGGMFRSSNSVKKQREKTVTKDNKLTEDVLFKSPSSAANFVTGRSTNGLIAWKTEKGLTLKKLLEQTTLE